MTVVTLGPVDLYVFIISTDRELSSLTANSLVFQVTGRSTNKFLTPSLMSKDEDFYTYFINNNVPMLYSSEEGERFFTKEENSLLLKDNLGNLYRKDTSLDTIYSNYFEILKNLGVLRHAYPKTPILVPVNNAVGIGFYQPLDQEIMETMKDKALQYFQTRKTPIDVDIVYREYKITSMDRRI